MRVDPHEPERRMQEYRKDPGGEDFFLAFNQALERAALPALAAQYARDLPIVYIVGAPRSGTTLLHQLISRHLPVGYINNLIARFWLRPSAGVRLSRALLGEKARERVELRSTHGVTHELEGPHEFGYFWRHWLPLDQSLSHHLDDKALAMVDEHGLTAALEGEILAAFGTPVVLKNNTLGFHAGFLTRLHPNSLFVHIKRDPLAAAASILKCRLERFGSYEAWWSLKPSTFSSIAAESDPAAQVARQTIDCRHETEQALSAPGVRALALDYHDLCADPGAALEAITCALGDMGKRLEICGHPLPKLSEAHASPLAEGMTVSLWTNMERLLRRLDGAGNIRADHSRG